MHKLVELLEGKEERRPPISYRFHFRCLYRGHVVLILRGKVVPTEAAAATAAAAQHKHSISET